MKRKALFAIAAMAGLLALRQVLKDQRPRMMETMASRLETMMPEGAPPARMLRELTAIREQTDRILHLLQEHPETPN